MIISLAVRLAVPVEKVLGGELAVAVGASKVLHVPRLSQGGHHLAHNRLVARVAAALLHRRYTLPEK